MSNGPKVLVLDIETSYIVAPVWRLWDVNVAPGQIKEDWTVISWSAKWWKDPARDIMYQDQRGRRDIRNDKQLLKKIWRLLDEADIIITQNGKKFDQKKLNARFLINGFKPPSSYKHWDTKVIAQKHFGFTSNGLEYMTNTLNKKYRKLKHAKFPGMELWDECLANNPKAWDEMEKYNKHDVLATEELFDTIIPWDSQFNISLYYEAEEHVCTCGSVEFQKNGFHYTTIGKFQRHKCIECGSEVRDRTNLFTKEKRASLKGRAG